MKIVPLILVGLLLSFSASAKEIDGVTIQAKSVAATLETVTTNGISVFGKVLAIEIQVPANTTQTVTITTMDGVGASISGAKTLLPEIVLTADLSTNFTPTVYLIADKFIVTYSNSWSAAIKPNIMIVIDPDN